MRQDIVPGGLFPDYELRDPGGTKRKLSALQGADPMVLVLSRGSFDEEMAVFCLEVQSVDVP